MSKSEVPLKVGAERVKLAFNLEYCSSSYMRALCSATEEAR